MANFKISKVQQNKGLVSGWANVSLEKDGSLPLDWQGDIIPPEVLEDAAITFMKEYRASGEQHIGGTKGTVVESITMTRDKQDAMGIPEGYVPQGWFITVHFEDQDIIRKVLTGEYRMFSIQGLAERKQIQSS